MKPTIIVMDDQPTFRNTTVFLLGIEGFQVIPTVDGSHLDLVVRECEPAVILLDPYASGVTVERLERWAWCNGRPVPLVGMGGRVPIWFDDFTFDGWVEKPFTPGVTAQGDPPGGVPTPHLLRAIAIPRGIGQAGADAPRCRRGR